MNPRVLIVTESRRHGSPCWTLTTYRHDGTRFNASRRVLYTTWTVATEIDLWDGPVKFRITDKARKHAL